MTTYTRTALKTFFETGDIPFGVDYANLIDSCANIVDTSAQSFNSPIQTPEIIATKVSAATAHITGALSAGSLYIGAITLSAGNLSVGGNLLVSGDFTFAGITGSASIVTRNIDTSAHQISYEVHPADMMIYRQRTTLGHAFSHTLEINRNADYVGGSAGWVNGGLFVKTSVAVNAQSYEWAIVGTVYNSSNFGQNVGVYGQGYALTATTGGTWGMVADAEDHSGGERASGGTIGLEVDCFANGVNTAYRNRIGAQIVAGTYNLGTAAEIWAGLYFTNFDRAYYNNVIHIGNDPNFTEPTFGVTTGIRVTNVSGTAMLWDDATWVNGIKLTGTYSGDALIVSGRVSATGGISYGTPAIVSAAGTSQAAAAILNSPINRGQGVADGVTTGFAIPANRTGLIQYFNYEGAVSANLWPPTGGTINNLGANGVYVLNPRTMYQIIHLAASSYAVGSFFSIG